MSDLYTLADDIAARGIKHIFGIPGSGASLTLIDALEKKGVSFYLTHFEGTGVLMAGAIGRLSGKAGTAIGIKGPGLANMLPGLSACLLENFPVVTMTEAYTPDIPLSKAHKRMDHAALVAGNTKGRRFFSSKGPGFSALADWAETEIPGPVHLDFSGSAIEADDPVPVTVDHENDGDKQEPFDLVSKAERPVLICGTLAIRKALSKRLNTLSVPVFSVAAAKGVVDETLPQAAGVYTGAGLELVPEFSLIPMADLVIGIGLRHNEVLAAKPFNCQSVNIETFGNLLCEGFSFDHIFPSDNGSIESIFSALETKSWGIEELNSCNKKMRDGMLKGPFMPAAVFETIESNFNNKVRLVLDTGNFCTIGEHIWRVKYPQLYLSAGQGRYMGIGLPLSLGAALYDPDIPTVAVLGDGGVGMFISDIKIAVQNKLPLLVVLMSDGFLGSIRVRSLKDGLTEKPVTIEKPSWVKVLTALGVRTARATGRNEIENIVASWSPSKGPLFIEVHFNPEEYQAMVNGIR